MRPGAARRIVFVVGPAAAVLLAILAPVAMVLGTWPAWTALGVAGAAAISAGAVGAYRTATDIEATSITIVD